MRKSVLVSLALVGVLSASAVLADCPCQPAPRPLRADGPVNPHRPTMQLAEGLVFAPRPLIQLADGPPPPKRPPLQLADNTHVPRPLLADSDTADAVLHRPLLADVSNNMHRPLLQVADATGLTPVKRPLRAARPDLGIPQLAEGLVFAPRPLI